MRGLAAWCTFVLVLGLFSLSASPASAGSKEAPEIVDAVNDQVTEPGGENTCPGPGGVTNACFSNVDIVAGWVDGETDTEIQVNLQIQGTGAAATLGTSYEWNFRFEIAGTSYVATARQTGTTSAGAVGPFTGVNSAAGVATAVTIADQVITLTVPKANIGDPAPGAVMTALSADAKGMPLGLAAADVVTDRAPDSGTGADYVLGSAGGAVDANDTDADGLNDTWEIEQFGNLTAQNGTGDPDGDGLNNTAEFELGTNATLADTDADGLSDGNETEIGTNATLADTDGDGALDGEEVEAGTDPLDPTDFPAVDAGNDTDGPDLGNGTLEQDADGTSGGGDGDGEKAGLAGYLEDVKAETGYAGASAAGMAAVLLLSIIGLAGRWGL